MNPYECRQKKKTYTYYTAGKGRNLTNYHARLFTEFQLFQKKELEVEQLINEFPEVPEPDRYYFGNTSFF